jgi:AraC-like DNA-binding protein
MKIIRAEEGWRMVHKNSLYAESLENLARTAGYRVCELCQALNVSESYLREVFMRDIGLPPKEWMSCERMVAARRMVRQGRSSMDVAGTLGFADVNSFRREFKVAYGVSPRLFVRKEMERG